jgi:hypothetical protein
MASTSALVKAKNLEPPVFHGEVNKVDNWLYSLELYFGVVGLDFNNANSKQCASFAGALLRGNAL